MQSLHPARNKQTGSYLCAEELLETVPLVMRVIRTYMRGHRSGLTVPQFRTLCYTDSTPEGSLSDTADFIGLSLPAMSRLVDGLVDKGLMKRRASDNDRRHLRLSLTPAGQTALRGARAQAQAKLAEVVTQLDTTQHSALIDTMRMVRELFANEVTADDEFVAVPERVRQVKG
jgi:DNA-binding MarR family transcriptional regulator